jgi:hypothetical protein
MKRKPFSHGIYGLGKGKVIIPQDNGASLTVTEIEDKLITAAQSQGLTLAGIGENQGAVAMGKDTVRGGQTESHGLSSPL